MKKINLLLDKVEPCISSLEKTNTTISNSNVGWHIQHILLTVNAVINAVAMSNGKDFKPRFNFIKMLILTTGKIPRGKAKAPKVVTPTNDYTFESLTSFLAETRKKLETLNTMQNNQFFNHPLFGHFKLQHSIGFIEIHTKHHLSIIQDIIK